MLGGERGIRCRGYFKFEQLEAGPDGFGICHKCAVKISGADEPSRPCPVDGNKMTKTLLRGLVLVDQCLSCKGVWFDRDELQVVERVIRAEGRVEGFFGGMWTGLIN